VLGQQRVVRATQQTDVLGTVVASVAEGVAVVELHPVALRTVAATLVHIAASSSIPLGHHPPHRGRDLS
jgi:hypothetical protein